eukprot:CAMPEP_0114550602 /NCGR_PEP_ID=MMETSP0114-20121206/6158_1 /TAXON_ID=31324 /ORGANISM="Goniomonas sp, Strain m" /LENGTH=116 /DNA_ID=CAMNT_0001735381 /DNA_START=42 /DNA_END=389 /DNA_ORIENTATION=+
MGDIVALRSHHNHYLSARDNGRVEQMPVLGPWEKFHKVNHGGGHFSLRTWNNLYVSAREDGSVTLVPNDGAWERFRLATVPDHPHKVALRTDHHHKHKYISAHENKTTVQAEHIQA